MYLSLLLVRHSLFVVGLIPCWVCPASSAGAFALPDNAKLSLKVLGLVSLPDGGLRLWVLVGTLPKPLLPPMLGKGKSCLHSALFLITSEVGNSLLSSSLGTQPSGFLNFSFVFDMYKLYLHIPTYAYRVWNDQTQPSPHSPPTLITAALLGLTWEQTAFLFLHLVDVT